MIRGLYTSAKGLAAGQQKLEVISNNLANVNTNGYKRDKTAVVPFYEHVVGHNERPQGNSRPAGDVIGRLTYGAAVEEIVPDLRPGLLVETGVSTDLALTDGGFFSIRTRQGDTVYTRDGAFHIDQEGYLVTAAGDQVLGGNGPLRPGSNPKVGSGGRIYSSAGTLVDTILAAQFDENARLTKIQNNYFTLPEDGEPDIMPNPALHQGFLEKSNVSMVDEMVDLIEVSRVYQFNQRLLRAQDQLLEKAVTQIGIVK